MKTQNVKKSKLSHLLPQIDELQVEYLRANNTKTLAVRFAEWLHENRWFSFSDGKWNYTFEHGTSINKESYNKNYRKTTSELYDIFLSEEKERLENVKKS